MSHQNVLIAGGGGYVGSVLARHLHSVGNAAGIPAPRFNVETLDRFLYGPNTSLPGSVTDGDIRNVVPADLEGVDAVVNLAGFSNDPTAEYNPEANTRLNVGAAVELMRTAARAGVQRYVFASSASVYDGCADQDMATESSDLKSAEDMFPYSQSKIQAELILTALAAEKGISLVILRKGTVHGYSPRMRFDLVVNNMVLGALYPGLVECHTSPVGPMNRPIVDVNDVALAYEKALTLQLHPGQTEIFNIVTDNLSVTEIAATVVSAVGIQTGKAARLKMGTIPANRNIRSYRMSDSRAMAILGWKPALNLHESVLRMVPKIQAMDFADLWHPRTNNIDWMKIMLQAEESVVHNGPLLGS